MGILINKLASEIIGSIELKIRDNGYAILGKEWKGVITSPPYSRLYFILDGDPFIILNGKKISLKKGHVYLIPQGLSYTYDCDTHMEQLYFHFNLTNYNGYDVLSSCPGYIEEAFSLEEAGLMIALYQSENILDSLILKQKIFFYIMRLLQKQDNWKLENKKYSLCVSKAIAYIQNHLSLNLTVKCLAKKTFTSESSLVKKFKNETGVSVGKYIDDLILYQSEQFLIQSDMSILQISEHFGFCDQFYFSRKFKDKFGIAPNEYRKRKGN